MQYMSVGGLACVAWTFYRSRVDADDWSVVNWEHLAFVYLMKPPVTLHFECLNVLAELFVQCPRF